ncbi:hypothetical protein CkaCkLH20_05424 [Colletotrichum karsti]|uniref:Uncharacterized protein n=1 Tax=Colletotrichum karsti TaxID=1095194 RepID=A0A9P6I699_9PEZI|nr:uncharacterized protein CkaCkLH20_05424 [Colletotrichum karsti]KAF9877158.1 hypothetical protein CkaCkLH20_05424 [Colletotrichum karsti]
MDDILTDNIVDLVEEIELELDTGTYMGRPFAIIGWNGAKVMQEAAELIAEPSNLSALPNIVNKAWRGAMALHREYLANTAAAELKETTSTKPRSRKMRLDDAVGSYVIKCPTIVGDWPEYGPVFHLEIKDRPGREGDDGLLSAKMNFGIVEGTMLLSFSKETLNMTSKATRLDAVDQLSRITVAEIPEYHIPSTANDERKDIAIEERVAESRKRSAPASRSKSNGSSPPHKKAKLNTRQVMRGRRRLYFIWRGTEKEDELSVESKGYLDFNDTCTGFKGVTWLDFAAFDRDAGLEDCTFQGFKYETMKPRSVKEETRKVRLSDSDEETAASDLDFNGSESDLEEIPASCLINFQLHHGA